MYYFMTRDIWGKKANIYHIFFANQEKSNNGQKICVQMHF